MPCPALGIISSAEKISEISFSNFKIQRPQIHENNGATKLMFPHEARLRNFTYGSSMTIDLNIKYFIGKAQVDLNKMIISIDEKNKKINTSEKKVLIEMLTNPGKTYSREDIGKISGITQERSIDVMITRLRQKIEKDSKNPKYLQTIRGSGYVLWIE